MQVLENGNSVEVSTTKLIEDTATELPFTPLQDDSWNVKFWLDGSDTETMTKEKASVLLDLQVKEIQSDFGEIKAVRDTMGGLLKIRLRFPDSNCRFTQDLISEEGSFS